MGKHDLERNMRIIEENEEAFKDSNGFNVIEEKTGIKKEKLMREFQEEHFEFEKHQPSYQEMREKAKEEEEKLKEEHQA